jgi:hypothetical protein
MSVGDSTEKEFKLNPLSCLGVLLYTPLISFVIKLVGSSFFQYTHHRWYILIGILVLHLIALVIGVVIVALIVNGIFYISDKLFVKRFRF